MMMRDKDKAKTDKISQRLDTFAGEHVAMPGLTNATRKNVLVAQIVDSLRRIEYLNAISARSKSANLHTPYSGSFEPFGGAAALHKAGKIDDAYWLVYLATHFGRHKSDGWNLTEDIYGRFGQGGLWDWANASQDPNALGQWLTTVHPALTRTGRSRRFGNHRKFETLKSGTKGTGHAVATYINWVVAHGSHSALIKDVQAKVGQNPQEAFGFLYRDLRNVAKLGRLGKFDLLCNWSNLMIAPIFPDKAYIAGSTGPLAGAKLLFGNGLSLKKLEDACAQLATHLDVSPQVIEDSLCNWQKSPGKYLFFRG
jgi:hypothetical protein